VPPRTACHGRYVRETASDRAFEVLSAAECRRLLATRQLGRIGLTGVRFPLILPVNYALDGDVIVVRTDSRSILAAIDHGRVAFEVDEIDERTRSGWSVLAQAVAQEVTALDRDDLLARTRASGVEPWAPGDRGHWIRLVPLHLTGRRVVPGQLPPPFEEGSYP
jgi:nitroimidazol reductase NimA-like FMN-containing flavoprotein (pyridoxamine 5'-phosphate oxidase superfamily)